jgi:putative hemolysin
VGVTHLRDLLVANKTVRDVMREPIYASMSTKAHALFRTMNTQRSHLAVLLNDVGDLHGIVTMEDIVEEIVGDIYDETDVGPTFVELPDGGIEIPGSFHIIDLDRLGFHIPQEVSRFANTASGALCHLLGWFPEAGDKVQLSGFEMVVLEASEMVATKVRVMRTAG